MPRVYDQLPFASGPIIGLRVFFSRVLLSLAVISLNAIVFGWFWLFLTHQVLALAIFIGGVALLVVDFLKTSKARGHLGARRAVLRVFGAKAKALLKTEGVASILFGKTEETSSSRIHQPASPNTRAAAAGAKAGEIGVSRSEVVETMAHKGIGVAFDSDGNVKFSSPGEYSAYAKPIIARKKLGIYASPEASSGFYSFVLRYWGVLARHEILTSENIAVVLRKAAIALGVVGINAHFKMEIANNARATINLLLRQKPDEIETVLVFLEPVSNAQFDPALQLLGLAGHKIAINFGAAQWAEMRLQRTDVGKSIEKLSNESLVLVEDNAVAPLYSFISEHAATIARFQPLITTSRMRQALQIGPKGNSISFRDSRDLLSSLPQLMNAQDSSRKVNLDRVWNVIAFLGHGQQSPGPEMRRFIEVCLDAPLRINLLLNERSATSWIRYFEEQK